VQSTYLTPLRRTAPHGIPICTLQLRSYSLRPLEFYADFALRAAYYLSLPASGPVPLPRITERFTVPRSSFVHKKSQENFERVTYRRSIQIKDATVEGVKLWLGYLGMRRMGGVGIKADWWEWEGLDVGEVMRTKEVGDGKWERMVMLKDVDMKKKVERLLAGGQLNVPTAGREEGTMRRMKHIQE